MKHILYLHGLFSTPSSEKAQFFKSEIEKRFDVSVQIPQLSANPSIAIQALEQLTDEVKPMAVIGSSMGGFHATWISAKLQIPAVLINPAVGADHLMEDIKGKHTYPSTNEEIDIDEDSIALIAKYDRPKLLNENLLLCLLQTGDETLNYRNCTNRYQNANFHITTGGDHSYQNFEYDLPIIIRHFQLK